MLWLTINKYLLTTDKYDILNYFDKTLRYSLNWPRKWKKRTIIVKLDKFKKIFTSFKRIIKEILEFFYIKISLFIIPFFLAKLLVL